MRVGLLTSSVSREAGGLLDVTRGLALALHHPPKMAVEVLGLRDRYTDADLSGWDGLKVKAVPTFGPDAVGFAPGLGSALAAAELDLLHVHGLWMYPSLASLRWTRGGARRALLVSPHGMLDPWALNNGRWKKRIVRRLYEDAHLREADCLHALTNAELEAIRAYGLKGPVCVVPNAVVPPRPAPLPDWRSLLPSDAKVLLYLGRLHPKKGLAALLDAWAAVQQKPEAERWHLVVAGWDQNGYEAELRGRAARLCLRTVHFIGPHFGSAKDGTYAAANAFVLPSLSEGLPMVVLEAWSHGLPVLKTAACNLPEGFRAGAAVELASDPDGAAATLLGFLGLSDEMHRDIGTRGRALVAREYSWARVARDMAAVYAWLTGASSRPDCVF